MCLKNPLENKRHRKARCVERMLKAEITSVLTKSEGEKVIASSPCSNSLLQSVPAAALPPPTPLGSLSLKALMLVCTAGGFWGFIQHELLLSAVPSL